MKHLFFTLFLCLCPFFSSAHGEPAYEITPSHVYQSTEKLRLTLEALNLIDVEVYQNAEKDEALRHPRHVMQAVRECSLIFSKILQERHLEPSPLPDLFSVREIRPSDVKNGVEYLISEVLKVGAVDIEEEPEFVGGKVPNDVYNNLHSICQAVRAEIVPSDVYQLAKAINENLDKLVEARGYKIRPEPQNFSDKAPGDVYLETKAFLEDLRVLSLNHEFAIPGGVIISSQKPKGEVKPKDVVTLMNDALAEVSAIKYALGVREQFRLPPYEEGKTPSDVFSQIQRAHAVLRALMDKEGGE